MRARARASAGDAPGVTTAAGTAPHLEGDLPAVLTRAAVVRAGRTADLRAGFVRATHGVHVAAGVGLDDPDVRTSVAMARVPASVTLGGWAAARIHERTVLADPVGATGASSSGVRLGPPLVEPVFDGDGPAEEAAVLILAPPETRLARAPGRRLFRSRVGEGERVELDGTAVTTPLRTAFDLARLSAPTTAVIGLDRLRALGLLDAGDLLQLLDDRPRWLGVQAARRALHRSADGVESPQETRMRLLWTAAGLPVPLCNPDVLDDSGRFVARVDLLDAESGLVGEYDGAVHSSAMYRSGDAVRQERLESLGLVVVRATSADLATSTARDRWQQRLHQARRRAVARRSAGRWRAEPGTGAVLRPGGAAAG